MDQRLELLRSLAVENQTKMVLLVMDGLGGLPSESGMTELEKAITPNLDEMAAHGETGLLEIVDTGITPGSGPGHLALFGYNPLRYRIGRGILETLGVGAEVKKGEVCARGNFCTWREGDIIDDRRAGRIPTPDSAEIVKKLSESIKKVEDVDVRFYPGMEHRFAVVFSGEGLSEKVADADPQQEGRPMKWAGAFDPSGEKTARIANGLIRRVREVLGDQPKASGCLLRGFSGVPDIPAMTDLYSMKAAAVASYPMYRGLARLVGMDVLEAGKTVKELFDTVLAFWDAYDYFYVHVKYTDSRGEDGDFEAKRKVIEEVDDLLPALTAMRPEVLVVTGDHSTPSVMSGHSWHPSPVLLSGSHLRPDNSPAFGERVCAHGGMGRMKGYKLMGLMLAHAERLAKFGA